MASEVLALNAVVKADYTTPDTFVAVGEVTSFTAPNRSRATIDKTTLDDTLKTYAAGVEEFSEFTFTQRWEMDDAAHLLVDTSFGNGDTDKYQIAFANTGATVWEFSGFISNLSATEVSIDDIHFRDVTVQRTTAITVT